MCPRDCSYFLPGFFLLIFAATGPTQSGSQSAAPSAAAPQAQTQPSGAPDQPATVLRVTTRLVVVDVVAMDNKGAPVTDLKADDFTVQEESVEQPIQVFSFHQSSPAPEGPAANIVPIKLPEGYYTNIPRYKTSGALNVLLLDGVNSDLINQASMRDAMIKFLDKIPAGEPIAIYLMGNKLTLIQDFTSDPEVLRKAIAGVKRQGPKALSNPAGNTRMAEIPIGSVAADTIATMMPALTARLEEFRDQQNASQADFRVRFTLDALNSLARFLAGYPGRKNLVWISETFPFTLVMDKVSSINSRNYAAEVARTGNLLSNAQVAIYPVDARTLVGSSQFSVGSDPNPMGVPEMRKQRLEGEAGKVVSRESDDRMVARSTMNDLADKTGGRAFYNTNDLEGAVRRSLQDGSTYYTLGYYPANRTWDGGFRRISVKTIRPGFKLHYRQGYFAVEPMAYAKLDASQKSSDLAQALSLDFPIATALRFQAAVAPATSGATNKVTVNYAVDPHQLSFELQSDGLQHASVDCALIVYSREGDTLQTLSNTMMAALKAEEYNRVMQKSFPCRQTFDLAPGQYLLRLGVRDARTGLVGTLNAPLTIPTSSASGGPQPAEKKP